MPLYEYKCPECGTRGTSMKRGDRLVTECPTCQQPRDFKRVFGFALAPIMHEHFNNSVGKPISDMGKYREALKVKSAQDAERLGMDVNYQPIDMGDREALGVTGEGIDESNRVREKRGEPLLPSLD